MLGLFVALVMLFLSVIHLYWAFFPKRIPSAKIIPYVEGKPALYPTPIKACIVAVFLALIAIFTVELAFPFINFPSWLLKLGGPTLALVFLIRALGDFHFVGFFKSIKDSEFAFYDTRFYSPLCVMLGMLFLILAWNR